MAMTPEQARVVEELKSELRSCMMKLLTLPDSWTKQLIINNLNMTLSWVDELLTTVRVESENLDDNRGTESPA